jgi:chorismate mutase
VSHVDEIKGLRHLNDHLNAEIVEKISEWVDASGRLAEINRAHGGSPEALKEELFTNFRRAASTRGLDPERLERIFAAMMEIRSGLEVGSC